MDQYNVFDAKHAVAISFQVDIHTIRSLTLISRHFYNYVGWDYTMLNGKWAYYTAAPRELLWECGNISRILEKL